MLGYDGVIWKNNQFELGLKRINFSIYSGVPNTFLPSPLPNTTASQHSTNSAFVWATQKSEERHLGKCHNYRQSAYSTWVDKIFMQDGTTISCKLRHRHLVTYIGQPWKSRNLVVVGFTISRFLV